MFIFAFKTAPFFGLNFLGMLIYRVWQGGTTDYTSNLDIEDTPNWLERL